MATWLTISPNCRHPSKVVDQSKSSWWWWWLSSSSSSSSTSSENHNKIPLSDWLSAALITALIRQCYRTVRVIVHTHFYDLFFSLLAKTLTQSCLLIWSYQKINVVIVMINISDRNLSRPIWSLIILIIKQIRLQLSRHPILLISGKIQGYHQDFTLPGKYNKWAGIRQLGISFGSIFLLLARGHIHSSRGKSPSTTS